MSARGLSNSIIKTNSFFQSVSTIAALGLDIYVQRQQTRRGIYRLHDMDGKRDHSTAAQGPFADVHEPERRESGVWDEPRLPMGPYGEQGDSKVQQRGYAVPENQFDYDTGYGGPSTARI